MMSGNRALHRLEKVRPKVYNFYLALINSIHKGDIIGIIFNFEDLKMLEKFCHTEGIVASSRYFV